MSILSQKTISKIVSVEGIGIHTGAKVNLKILPSEWSIDFQGPILGHIEHPQNCYLATVDVDYSGGKDMSFIEKTTANLNPLSFEHGGEYDTKGNPIDDKYYNEDGTVKDETEYAVLGGETEVILERFSPLYKPNMTLSKAAQLAINSLSGSERDLVPSDLEVAELSIANGRRAFRRINGDELDGILS